ncbi:MAG: haloacid dehalogenase-like hydrolase [Ruminococcaceae bacterium]|nr:haloacid dehalogenase-like hydrolase [Oscillospiraceae bacterium]
MEKILYCDFDGTLIQENSEVMLVNFLIKSGYFKIYHYVLALICKIINVPRRLAKRGVIIKAWTAYLSNEKKDELIEWFWKQKISQIHINQNVLEKIKDFDGKTIILTGSDQQLVYSFLRKKGIIDLIEKVIGNQVGKSGIRVLCHPYGRDKCKLLSDSAYKVGIANESADIFYLSECDEAYIVSGDAELENAAKKNGWRMI